MFVWTDLVFCCCLNACPLHYPQCTVLLATACLALINCSSTENNNSPSQTTVHLFPQQLHRGGCGSEGGAGIKVDGSEPPPPLVHYFPKVFFFFLIFWGTYILFHQCVAKRNKMFWVTWVTLFEDNFWTFFILVSWPHSVSSPVTQMMSQISSWIESMRQVWQKWPESECWINSGFFFFGAESFSSSFLIIIPQTSPLMFWPNFSPHPSSTSCLPL